MDDYSKYDYEERRRAAAKRRAYEKRRRAHIRKQRLVFGGGGLLLILLVVLLLRSCGSEPQEISLVGAPDHLRPLPEIYWDENEPIPGEEVEPAKRTVRLAAVGDIMCYDEHITDAQTETGYDFGYVFDDVRDELTAPDLTVGNLETTFSDGNPYEGKPNFNSPPELAAALSGAGFNLLSTANTYSIQYGINGLFSTKLHVQQAGMDAVGTFTTEDEAKLNGGAVFRDVNGVRVAFLAYTKGVNNMYLPDGYEYSVGLLYSDYFYTYTGFRKTEILSDIQAVKNAGADIIVCMLHWGSEYETTVSDSQKTIADALIAAGVDVILGSHSHVVGSIELREAIDGNGDTQTGLVAWSLGNFYSYMEREGTMSGIILQLEMTVEDNGAVTFSEINYVPVTTTFDEGGHNFKIRNIPLEESRYLGAAEDAVDAATYEKLQSIRKQLANRVGTAYILDTVE